jgi:hypothetical protein
MLETLSVKLDLTGQCEQSELDVVMGIMRLIGPLHM